MHVILERARKAAGISGMKRNYPDDPKQRGCGYWAAFLGSVSNDLGKLDQETLETTKATSAKLSDAHRRIEELEAELRKTKDHAARTGVEVIRQHEGWSIEKGQEVLKTIAG